MKRSILGPALLFALVLAVGDAAVVWYFEELAESRRSTEAERVRGLMTGTILRHLEAVRHLGSAVKGGEVAEQERAESIAQLFPALAGVARFGADGKAAFAANVRGLDSGAARLTATTPAAKAALAGAAAVDDPSYIAGQEGTVAIWTPADKGAVAGIFRLDRLISDAVNASAGEDSPFVLADSRGRKPVSREPVGDAGLRVDLSLPGLTWTLHVRQDTQEISKSRALVASIVVMSLLLWGGYVVARRRGVVDRERLEARAGKIDRMAKEVEALAGVERRERGKLFTILDSLDESVILAGPAGETLMVNAAGETLLGPEPKFVKPDGSDIDPSGLPVAQAISRKAKVSSDDLCAQREGLVIPLSITAAPMFDQDKQVIGAVAVHRDVSKQREWEDTMRARDFALTIKNKLAAEMAEAKDDEEVLRRLNYHLEAVLQPLSMNVFLKRPGSERLRAERTTGLKPEPGFEAPVIANPGICPVLETGEPMDPRTCDERVQPCLGRISPGGFLCAPISVGGKVEGTIHLELQSPNPDPARVELALDLIRSASAAVQAKRYLALVSQAAIRDPLTGLYNRRHFDTTARVMVAQAKRFHHPLGVLMIDIDHFKKFNDTYGHDAGDIVLREFAKSLQATARGSDVMVRYGGEEFAVLLAETGLGQARIAAERVMEATRRIVLPIKGLEYGQVTVSIGVSAFPEHGDTPESLVKAADTALYAAKAAGRNCARSQGDSKAPTVAEAPPGAAKA
ncbi:MAG: PAS/PAC and GAF sensor-containing diguanylate [Planctomycetota bacterium]|nr:MAG: PAS/PAC and GAF sensor-containing diguanylate [Planctomycetota bacterium]